MQCDSEILINLCGQPCGHSLVWIWWLAIMQRKMKYLISNEWGNETRLTKRMHIRPRDSKNGTMGCKSATLEQYWLIKGRRGSENMSLTWHWVEFSPDKPVVVSIVSPNFHHHISCPARDVDADMVVSSWIVQEWAIRGISCDQNLLVISDSKSKINYFKNINKRHKDIQ